MRRLVLLVVGCLAAAMLAGVLTLTEGPAQRLLTVHFSSTVSLYEGAQVKVLGVQVGTVRSIAVDGTHVTVKMSYDPQVSLPADVHAVVVPPSVVGDRFVQLTPAYSGGPRLPDGATLGLERSGVPLELDDTYRSLDQLAASLGPRGANADGALSRLVSAGADNLRGRGRLVNSTVHELADAIGILAASSDDINGTTTNLAHITRRFAADDETVRRLVEVLVRVSLELNGQRDELATAVTRLDSALQKVGRFTRENRKGIHGTVQGLTEVSAALARHTRELEEVTDLAPVGLVNLMHTYVPRNWDPRKPWATGVDGRTGSQNLHAVALQDLDVQLSYAMSTMCASLSPAQAATLRPFCTALEKAGGDMGALLTSLSRSGGGVPTAPSAADRTRLLGDR